MITYGIYSIKDTVTGNFSDIIIMVNEEAAKRYFMGLCQESKIKNDLQLYCLGSYNVETGEIESKVDFIVGGADFNV